MKIKRIVFVMTLFLMTFVVEAQTTAQDRYVSLRNQGLVSAKEYRWADALRQLTGAQGLNDTYEIRNDIKVVHDSIDKINERAQRLMKNEKYEDAIKLFKSLEGTPKESFVSIGICFERLGNYKLAMDVYEEGMKKQEKEASEHYNSLKEYVSLRNQGLASVKEHRWADALRQLIGAQDLNDTYEIRNDIKVVHDSIDKTSERAQRLMKNEKYVDAIKLFKSLEGTSKESYVSIGICYERLGNYKLAMDAYEEGMKKQEKGASEHYNSLKKRNSPSLWEKTWKYWRYGEPFLGFSYNYSRSFPLSLTAYLHSGCYYLGLEFGFNLDNKKYSFSTTEREKIGNSSTSAYSYVIINGDTISSSSIGTDDYYVTTRDYDIDPIAYFGVVPGLNFNFWSVSCGIGLMCCKEDLKVSSHAEGEGVMIYNNSVVDYPLAFYLSPGIHTHIPIPGTDGDWRITPYVSYRFMFAFRTNLSKAMSNYNGWAFGVGLEFNID